MTGLGCRPTSLMTASPYPGRLALCVLGQGLDHSVQVQVLSYTAKTNRFGVWLNALSRLNFSWLCSRPTSTSNCSPGLVLSLTHGACAPHPSHAQPSSSLHWEFPASALGNVPTACLLLQLITATLSRSKSV